MSETCPVLPARALFTEQTVVFPELDIVVPNSLAYSNAHRFKDKRFEAWLTKQNVTRQIRQPSVLLGRYPSGTLLDTAQSHLLFVEDSVVLEQKAPWLKTVKNVRVATRDDCIYYERPCLLAARYGETTWGHWLVEILPKILIAEMVRPGYFDFVIPAGITRETSDRSYSTSVLESLAASGIQKHRVIPVAFPSKVVFSNLHDVANVFSDGIHPLVLEAMRDRIVGAVKSSKHSAIATLRAPETSRALLNHDDISNHLRKTGFHTLSLSKLNFQEQVSFFRNAEWIAGDLGSNIAGAIFLPKDCKIVSFAPGGWYDGYFINIFQRLNCIHADVRGASTFSVAGDVSKSSYVVHLPDLIDGLSKLANFDSNGVTVSGRRCLRLVGEVYLKVTFGLSGNSASFQSGKWSEPEAGHTWSLGNESSISMPLDFNVGQQLWLEVKGIVFVLPELMPLRKVEILLKGHVVHVFYAESTFHEIILVPVVILGNDSALILTFRHSPSPSPASLGLSEDTRSLGLGFSSIAILA